MSQPAHFYPDPQETASMLDSLYAGLRNDLIALVAEAPTPLHANMATSPVSATVYVGLAVRYAGELIAEAIARIGASIEEPDGNTRLAEAIDRAFDGYEHRMST